MIEPGVYRLCYRGGTVGECRRMGGPVGFLVGLAFKLVGKRGYYLWLPDPVLERICDEGELTAESRERLAPVVAAAAESGCSPIGFVRPPLPLSPVFRDAGAYWALCEDRRRILGAAYTHVQASGSAPPVRSTSLYGAMLRPDRRAVTVVTTRHTLDDLGWTQTVRLNTSRLADVAERLLAEARGDEVSFPDPHTAMASLDEHAREAWERKIARGLFLRVGEKEQARVIGEANMPRGR